MVFANIVGAIVNEILPNGYIVIFLMVLILGGIFVNIFNVCKKWKKENIEFKRIKDEKLKLKNQGISTTEELKTFGNENFRDLSENEINSVNSLEEPMLKVTLLFSTSNI